MLNQWQSHMQIKDFCGNRKCYLFSFGKNRISGYTQQQLTFFGKLWKSVIVKLESDKYGSFAAQKKISDCIWA